MWGNLYMKENRARSVIKTLSWRFSATFITITIVYMFTKELKFSLEVGFFEVIAKLLFYYAHERVWNKITWGKLQEI